MHTTLYTDGSSRTAALGAPSRVYSTNFGLDALPRAQAV